MGVNDWSQAERDLYTLGTRVLFDDMERQRQEWREGVALDTTATDAILAEAAARTRAAQQETRRYLASFYDEESVPSDPQQIPQDASGSGRGPATPAPGAGICWATRSRGRAGRGRAHPAFADERLG